MITFTYINGSCSAPEISIMIISSITKFAPEPPGLDRYRNELAADLFGVPASEANTRGLLLLRKLAAAAPDQDSDIAFLPQLRAVNVMKACQQWIASDEDVDEEVESVMALVFTHLAPVLQNVPGAHWDLIFDVIENNLEVRASFPASKHQH
jgi:E3 ubiquitin-protein ligase listerin